MIQLWITELLRLWKRFFLLHSAGPKNRHDNNQKCGSAFWVPAATDNGSSPQLINTRISCSAAHYLPQRHKETAESRYLKLKVQPGPFLRRLRFHVGCFPATVLIRTFSAAENWPWLVYLVILAACFTCKHPVSQPSWVNGPSSAVSHSGSEEFGFLICQIL